MNLSLPSGFKPNNSNLSPVVNPLEEALKKLDLKGTIVLLRLLIDRALQLIQEAEKPKGYIIPASHVEVTEVK